jgi:hypothetical protein
MQLRHPFVEVLEGVGVEAGERVVRVALLSFGRGLSRIRTVGRGLDRDRQPSRDLLERVCGMVAYLDQVGLEWRYELAVEEARNPHHARQVMDRLVAAVMGREALL